MEISFSQSEASLPNGSGITERGVEQRSWLKVDRDFVDASVDGNAPMPRLMLVHRCFHVES